jgi:hypothetical protein
MRPGRGRLKGTVNRPIRTIVAAGFLTIGVGFLTPAAFSAPLDDALLRLEELETERDQLLVQADSLGRLLSSLPDTGSPEGTRLLKEGERLGERAVGLELQILLVRQQCRSLAQQELDGLRDTSTMEGIARSAVLLDLLDQRLADRWGADPILVEPDPADGLETLLDKQAYLADIRDRLAAMQERLTRRIEQMRQEERLLRASERFADETRFLDEGGRVDSDPSVTLRGAPGEPPDDGMGRNVASSGGVENPAVFPSATRAFGQDDVGESTDLYAAQAQIERDLERVETALRATEDLLQQFTVTPR